MRPEDIPSIPVLARRSAYLVYGPLAEAPVTPDVVLLFVARRPDPDPVGSLAVARGRATAGHGTPGMRHRPAGEEHGTYGPQPRVLRRVAELAKANEILTVFHRIRRKDVEGGKAPTIRESLAAMASADRP